MFDPRGVLRLILTTAYSDRHIGRLLTCSDSTVSRYRRLTHQNGLTLEALEAMTDSDLVKVVKQSRTLPDPSVVRLHRAQAALGVKEGQQFNELNGKRMGRTAVPRKNYKTAEYFGVLHPHALKFVDEKLGEHYHHSSQHEYRRRLSELSQVMLERGIAIGDLDEGVLRQLVEKIPSYKGGTPTIFILLRFLRYLQERGLCRPPPPLSPQELAVLKLKDDFETYLRNQRGLRDSTIKSCWFFARHFLEFTLKSDLTRMDTLSPRDVHRYLKHISSRGRIPGQAAAPPGNFKAFLYYLFYDGITHVNLANCVPAVRRLTGRRLPRYLENTDVEKVLNSSRECSSDRVKLRNYAMLLLLARLALRGPEVIAMRLDDIDWRAGVILVRGKGQIQDKLPLPIDVGQAISDYLQHERPRVATRNVFLQSHAPHLPFKNCQMLNGCLRKAMAHAGVTSPAPFIGTHLLRHSLASRLAREGASLQEIGDLLRHRSPNSTMRYAKIDVDGLRTVATAWPVGGGR